MADDDAPPPLPDGTLVQSVTVDVDGAAAGYRIRRDGRYETLPRGGDWVEGERLDAARVTAVEQAIAASALDALPERLTGASALDAPHRLWFQAAGHHAVLVVGELRVPELEQLTAALTRALA